MTTVIKIENLWKEYRLGVIGHGTLTQDLQSWWSKVRNKEDPNSCIGMHSIKNASQINGNRFFALRDINLTIKKGEVLGIIGKNGAGKSTLLKMLSRVTSPSRGKISIKGKIASLLEVGTGFHPELTGRENVYLNGAILGMTKDEVSAKFSDILSFSGIGDFIDTPVKRYSSGMYVRLAFAVAAHLDPDILVIDEVLAVGDIAFQKQCLGKMQDISSEGRTVLFVSHNLGAVENLCSRAIIIDSGQIIENTSATKAVSKYRDSVNQFTEQDRGRVIFENHPGIKSGKERLIKFVSCTLENNRGECVDTFAAGEPININLQYKTIKDTHLLKNIAFHISIRETDGHWVSCLASDVMGVKIDSLPENGIIRCSIHEINLFPRRYTLTLHARVNGSATEVIDNSIFFDVKNEKFFPTGDLPHNDFGGVMLLLSEWEINKI